MSSTQAHPRTFTDADLDEMLADYASQGWRGAKVCKLIEVFKRNQQALSSLSVLKEVPAFPTDEAMKAAFAYVEGIPAEYVQLFERTAMQIRDEDRERAARIVEASRYYIGTSTDEIAARIRNGA